jgi:hypothetical protein
MSEVAPYTDQTAFTAMRNHVLSQTQQCYDKDNDTCLYHHEDNHCAVGALIADIPLSPKENKGGIQYLMDENPEVKKRIGECTLSLLKECQNAHDTSTNWDDNSLHYRTEAFNRIAAKFNLKVEEPE